MTIVEKLAFKDLYLAKVNLSHNEISKIEPGAFENCANITSLDLSYNKLENISKYSFDSATYATELQLSYNLFTSLIQVSGFSTSANCKSMCHICFYREYLLISYRFHCTI